MTPLCRLAMMVTLTLATMSREGRADPAALEVPAAPSAPAPPSGRSAPSAPNDAPPLRTALTFVMPDVLEAKLANGIRVQLVERHDLPVVSVYVASDVGGSSEPSVAQVAANAAISSAYSSHWFRHQKPFNQVGANLDVDLNYETTGISTRTLSANLVEAVSDLAELATTEFSSTDVVANARNAAIEGVWRSMVMAHVRFQLFPKGHPYRASVSGTKLGIEAASTREVRTFWRNAFNAAHVTIAVSGDVTMDRLLRALEPFSKLPPGTPLPRVAPVRPDVPARTGLLVLDLTETTQAAISVAAVAVRGTSPEWPGFTLMTSVLQSMLQDRVREQYGSTYGMSVSVDRTLGAPPVRILGRVENASCAKALEEIFAAMADLRAGRFSPAYLERARMFAYQSTARSFETTGTTASLLATNAALGATNADLRAIPSALASVTPAALAQMASRYFDPPVLRIVIAGDANVLVPELQKLKPGKIDIFR